MKRLVLIGVLVSVLIGCQPSTEVSITNNIPNVELDDIRFAGRTFGCCVGEGQTRNHTIRERRDEGIIEGRVSFLMRANGRSIRLITLEEYSDRDFEVTIEINRNTRVELDQQ